jgi:lysophospholipase
LDSSNIEIEGRVRPRPPESFLPYLLFFFFFRGTDWIRIATEIELNYPLFDAFVIHHGTDTMAYTSSALSFLLEDLGKTVVRSYTTAQAMISARGAKERKQVVTGAQIPLSQLRNDAVDNLLGALSIAGHYIIPGTSSKMRLVR